MVPTYFYSSDRLSNKEDYRQNHHSTVERDMINLILPHPGLKILKYESYQREFFCNKMERCILPTGCRKLFNLLIVLATWVRLNCVNYQIYSHIAWVRLNCVYYQIYSHIAVFFSTGNIHSSLPFFSVPILKCLYLAFIGTESWKLPQAISPPFLK